MSRMGCFSTIDSTVGLGSVKSRQKKFIRVGKGSLRHHMDLPPLTYEEWKKYVCPKDPSGIAYGAYLSRFKGRS